MQHNCNILYLDTCTGLRERIEHGREKNGRVVYKHSYLDHPSMAGIGLWLVLLSACDAQVFQLTDFKVGNEKVGGVR